MDAASIAERVKAQFGAKILDHYTFRDQHALTIAPTDLVSVAEFLRDDSELDFNILMDIGGVDYLEYGDDREWRFEVAYQFYSLAQNHRIRIKVAVESGEVTIPSLWKYWGLANWMEREVYDLFGITFTDHPNLRRILCHDDFTGHALRKDYPINRRQRLSRPIEYLLTDDPNWA